MIAVYDPHEVIRLIDANLWYVLVGFIPCNGAAR